MKLCRIILNDPVENRQTIDVPIADGNTFPNIIMQIRMQGFLLDGQMNVYVPLSQIKWAMQVETETTQGMTRQ